MHRLRRTIHTGATTVARREQGFAFDRQAG
ncbi:hypothetical protein BM43_3377 [Burkholderia gladioli]|uniref:Uncharacterized protein n=1 Tax=Burkholderia gladioli TaxID=28095 RepID=A0AAW3EPU9_BURGA|nr:hypothetical protein BM43_3377 [Burkholderia gladioli]KGC09813.1 hypothetical protein DM48_5539 [Burkholderia gladioli]SPU87517.1 Uncharacterised protein [Burkholderia gladioli]